MYGRYGYDTLSKTLLWVYAGVLLAYMILSLFVESILSQRLSHKCHRAYGT